VETEVKTFSDDLQSVIAQIFDCAGEQITIQKPEYADFQSPHFAPSITPEHPPERLSRISAFKLLADDGR